MAEGELPPEAFAFPGKDALIDQAGYDAVVERWARRTGGRVRE